LEDLVVALRLRRSRAGARRAGLCSPHGSQDDWKLVLFIRHLPQLTMEERLEMERDNPKSPRGHEKDDH
jgi:hypothetical protein